MSRPGDVYVIGYNHWFCEKRLVKIGFSASVHYRLQDLSTSAGFSLYCPESALPASLTDFEYLEKAARRYMPAELLELAPSPEPRAAEKIAHETLSSQRILAEKELFWWDYYSAALFDECMRLGRPIVDSSERRLIFNESYDLMKAGWA